MSDHDPQQVDQLVKAINQNTSWTGQTTRELRDKVEIASREIEALKQTLIDASQSTASELGRLTAAIHSYTASSDKLSGRMIWLTTILAIATVMQAFAACIMIFKR